MIFVEFLGEVAESKSKINIHISKNEIRNHGLRAADPLGHSLNFSCKNY